MCLGAQDVFWITKEASDLCLTWNKTGVWQGEGGTKQ